MQMQITGILSLLLFTPVVGAILLMFLPKPGQDSGSNDIDFGTILVNGVGIGFAGIALVLSCFLFAGYHGNVLANAMSGVGGNIQFAEKYRWIPMGAHHWLHWHLGADGFSVLLVLLTEFIILLSVVYTTRTSNNSREIIALLLLLEAAITGVYLSLNLVLFYVFFEATLIPTYLLIGMFGGPRRAYAAIKFFMYTFVGSILMLLAIASVYHYAGSLSIVDLSNPMTLAYHHLHAAPSSTLMLIAGAFLLAFTIKSAVFPFHAWLPDAYTQAPVVGSAALVLLKMGIFGYVHIALPIFPQQCITYAPVMIVLAVASIIYGSLLAVAQKDARFVIAYSSVAHLGFVVLGIFTFTRVGMMGAMIQNFNHGIFTPMLFLLLGMLFERTGTMELKELGGLKRVLPVLATMMLLATLASVAAPLFSGFVGEFPILLGSWTSGVTHSVGGYWPTALAATGTILSAVYMLWWFQRIMLGPIGSPRFKGLPDLTTREWVVLTPMAVMIFWVGIGSPFWTGRMQGAVSNVLPVSTENLEQSLPVSVMLTDMRERQEGNLLTNSTNGFLVTAPDYQSSTVNGVFRPHAPLHVPVPVQLQGELFHSATPPGPPPHPMGSPSPGLRPGAPQGLNPIPAGSVGSQPTAMPGATHGPAHLPPGYAPGSTPQVPGMKPMHGNVAPGSAMPNSPHQPSAGPPNAPGAPASGGTGAHSPGVPAPAVPANPNAPSNVNKSGGLSR
jgi:NADH-quinone oxidoreductase subunit M